MVNEKLYSTSKPAKTYLQLYRVFHFLFFVIGFSLGLIASSCFKTFPSFISFDSTIYSLSLSVPSPTLLSSPPHLQQSPETVVSTTLENNVTFYNTIQSLMHNMSDEELLLRASMAPSNSNDGMVKKIAFMFLTKGALPFAPLWEKYFQRHEGLYSIYVHPNPFYHDSWPQTSVFYGRRIPSQRVSWGTDSMMAAERRLLANALLDVSNQRFILLSESCIPLMNFTTTYDYLMNSNLSFVESYDNPKKPGRGRYNPKMSPIINITDWRKGSQWFEATRDLALKIVSDQKYYKVFREYCLPPCYFDEHYVPTLLNVLYPELSLNRTITYVDWSIGGAHPVKFGGDQITDEFLNQIRFGSECVYNGNTTSKCFMFARKFAPNALESLLLIAPLLLGFHP